MVSRDYRIDSDFPIEQKVSDDWDYASEKEQQDARHWDSSLSPPKKHIIGTLVTGDGRNKVKVRIVNGNVSISSH